MSKAKLQPHDKLGLDAKSSSLLLQRQDVCFRWQLAERLLSALIPKPKHLLPQNFTSPYKMQSQNKLEQLMDVISSMSKGELFSAYNIVKAYYEVSIDDMPVLVDAMPSTSSFYLSESLLADESLLMNERMDLDKMMDDTAVDLRCPHCTKTNLM
jgi:hypothetical protein